MPILGPAKVLNVRITIDQGNNMKSCRFRRQLGRSIRVIVGCEYYLIEDIGKWATSAFYRSRRSVSIKVDQQ